MRNLLTMQGMDASTEYVDDPCHDGFVIRASTSQCKKSISSVVLDIMSWNYPFVWHMMLQSHNRYIHCS